MMRNYLNLHLLDLLCLKHKLQNIKRHQPIIIMKRTKSFHELVSYTKEFLLFHLVNLIQILLLVIKLLRLSIHLLSQFQTFYKDLPKRFYGHPKTSQLIY